MSPTIIRWRFLRLHVFGGSEVSRVCFIIQRAAVQVGSVFLGSPEQQIDVGGGSQLSETLLLCANKIKVNSHRKLRKKGEAATKRERTKRNNNGDDLNDLVSQKRRQCVEKRENDVSLMC